MNIIYALARSNFVCWFWWEILHGKPVPMGNFAWGFDRGRQDASVSYRVHTQKNRQWVFTSPIYRLRYRSANYIPGIGSTAVADFPGAWVESFLQGKLLEMNKDAKENAVFVLIWTRFFTEGEFSRTIIKIVQYWSTHSKLKPRTKSHIYAGWSKNTPSLKLRLLASEMQTWKDNFRKLAIQERLLREINNGEVSGPHQSDKNWVKLYSYILQEVLPKKPISVMIWKFAYFWA